MAALKVANEIRVTRAGVRRAVKALPTGDSRAATAQIIRANPEVWHTAPLTYMLKMPRQAGPATVNRWLKTLGVTGTRKLGQLTDRQRHELAATIERGTG